MDKRLPRRILLIEPRLSGITAEKLLGALLDLGASVDCLLASARCVGSHLRSEVRASVSSERRGGIKAQLVEVRALEEPKPRRLGQLEALLSACSDELGLSREARRFSLETVKTLCEAESRVHGVPPNEVELYEVASSKSITLLLGVAMALDSLDLFRAEIYSTPVAVGAGAVKSCHGLLPVPSPATLEILRSRSIPIVGGPVEAELTTPLGASILVNLIRGVVSSYPAIEVRGVGYGAGEQSFEEFPNVLRLILGECASA